MPLTPKDDKKLQAGLKALESRPAIAARLIMQGHDFDPIANLIALHNSPTADVETKLEVCKSLVPYMYPKLSQVVVAGDGNAAPVRVELSMVAAILQNPRLAAAAQDLAIGLEDQLQLNEGLDEDGTREEVETEGAPTEVPKAVTTP